MIPKIGLNIEWKPTVLDLYRESGDLSLNSILSPLFDLGQSPASPRVLHVLICKMKGLIWMDGVRGLWNILEL